MQFISVFLIFVGLSVAWPNFHCPVDFQYSDQVYTLHFPNTCGMPSTINVAPSIFDVISFNGFKANTGDIQGRLFTQSFSVGAGFTVGWGLQSSTFLYGLVVNGNATFVSGDVQPNGDTIYVGQYFNAPSYLTDRRVPCSGQTVKGGWNTILSAAISAYQLLTSDLNSQSTTCSYSSQPYNVFRVLNFGSPAQKTYFLSININDFNKITSYSFDASPSSYIAGGILCINVEGKGTATFNGGQFPSGFISHVIYNFPAATNVIVNTGVWGDILAPYAALNQTGGVITGKVIVNDIVQALQINTPVCATSS